MSWLLPRLIGAGRAFDVMTRSTPIAADEAMALGLITDIVDDDALLPTAVSRAHALASLPDQSIRVVKRLLRASLSATLRHAFGT